MENEIMLDNLSAEQFDFILKYGKSSNKVLDYEAADFVSLPYGLIKRELPTLLKQAKLYKCVELVLKHTYKDLDLSKATGNELMAFLLSGFVGVKATASSKPQNMMDSPLPI